jgi:flagellar motor switch protein FliN/FliY
MDGMLSQDEINALFNNMPDSTEEASQEASADSGAGTPDTSGMGASSAADEDFSLADNEKDAVGEISNICMGTAATTLSSLLNQRVDITTPEVSISSWDELSRNYDRPCVMMQISYIEGIEGNNVLILREKDVKIITDLMMGGSGENITDDPLSELHLSAIGEAMNQMMGSAATSMSSMFNRKIDISPPVANLVEIYGDITDKLPEFLKHPFVQVSFRMTIGTLIDSTIMQLYPIDFAQELINMFAVETAVPEEPAPAPAPTPAPAPAPQQAAPQQAAQPMMGQPMMGQQMMGQPMMMGQQMMGQPMMGQQMMGQPMMGYGYPPQQDVNVQAASFQPFSNDLSALTQKENIDLIMDVPLEVTVELGRTSRTIKDILEFAPGTIVELNKIAGESVDVLVNGKNVAKGEVVVIEESFGVRITEIIKEQ